MALAAGRKFAHYEIVEPVGEGGMGVVYRARDTRLERDVAIKVLPDPFANDDERLRRFEKEAKALAALNHRGIAGIYGLEQSGETRFLALEYVPGETLAERIHRGAISADEAIPVAIQVAEAVENAHEHGIVHRDLKPANIKLNPDDGVKVLDFGLAKALDDETPEDGGSAATSMSPTMTRDQTRMGVILGTASYMSPEQAKGKRVDRRTDVFAFGAVLYEMLTGRRAFPGEDVSEVLAAVIKLEPDWRALPGDLDPRLAGLLRRCLDKSPKRRRQSVGDIRVDLEEIIATPLDTPSVSHAFPRRERLLWGGAVLLVALVSAAVVRWLTPPPPSPVTRFTIQLPESYRLHGTLPITVSPDGRTVIYSVTPVTGGASQLYRRRLDAFHSEAIPGTEGAANPFISPDGRSVGFRVGPELKVTALEGGTPVALAEAPGFPVATWESDDTIVFGGTSGIYRASAGGGEPELIAGGYYTGPAVLPGDDVVLYTRTPEGEIGATRLGSGESHVVTPGAGPIYLETGHLLFTRGNTVFAARFNLDELAMETTPVPVIDSAARFLFIPAITASREGTIVYVPGSDSAGGLRGRIVSVDRDGSETAFVEASRNFRDPRMASTGELVVAIVERGMNVWRVEPARGALTRLSFGGNDARPIWSRDGSQVIFSSNREGTYQLYRTAADGSGDVTRLTTGPGTGTSTSGSRSRIPSSMSADGTIVIRQLDDETGFNVGMVRPNADGSAYGSPEVLFGTAFNEHSGMLSPDDRFIAYVSDDSRREEVYVTTFPEPGGRRQISVDGGAEPVWSRDGSELFYRNGDKMMAVEIEVTPDGAIEPGRPVLLFEGPYRSGVGPGGNPGPNYDVTPDGRFIMIRDDEADASEIHVVVNWHQELERLVP